VGGERWEGWRRGDWVLDGCMGVSVKTCIDDGGACMFGEWFVSVLPTRPKSLIDWER
jgi:hypothetical protein